MNENNLQLKEDANDALKIVEDDAARKAKLDRLLDTRRGRKLLGVSLETSTSEKKCAVCPKTVGLTSLGQEKLYCSKECRKLRHKGK